MKVPGGRCPIWRSRACAVALGAGFVGALLLTMPEIAAAAGQPAGHKSPPRTADDIRWAMIVALLLGFVAVILFRGLVIGQDKRLSTSKTIAVTWTVVVAAALLAMVFADILDHPQALTATNASNVIGQYALLFGGPLGAAILAKGIVTAQVNKDATVKPTGSGVGMGDLINNDAGNTDLGDFQYVLFNFVALAFVLGAIFNDPIKGLPRIPDVLLGLTSVAAAGYVGKKALPPTDVAKAVLMPAEGGQGTPVTINVTGLTPASQPQASFWVRFGTVSAGVVTSAVDAGGATIAVNVPAPPAGAPVPAGKVAVTVVTEAGAVLDPGPFNYTA